MTPPSSRRTGIGTLLAIAALGMSAAMPAARASDHAAPSVTREFVAPNRERRSKKKRKAHARKRDTLTSQPWTRHKDGSAIDGRGDYRSAKRIKRQLLCALYGVTTGRQWVRLRRALRRAA